MRLNCPNCQAVINLLETMVDQEASCPSCGSQVPLSEVTITYRQQPAGQVGHFILLEEIGRGQFGTVWRARDVKLDRTVAIKIPRREELDERTRQMFLREAKAAASLDHPQIVRVFEVFEYEAQIYIVSEFVNGHTLRSCLDARRYPYREAAEFMAATALAIDYAHERGVIHRDLKPGNILVDGKQQPHVTDFGLAKNEANEITLTVTGDLLGTPAYMSPEQASGDGHRVDRRSDVFSLGVILYEMLTGQRPFQARSTALLKQILSDDPRALRTLEKHLPRDLETICLKALSKEKERRYATAKDMAEDLKRFLSGVPIKARPISRMERGVRWVRKNVTLATVGLVALGSSAAALALVQQGPREPVYPPGSQVEIISPLKFEITTEPAGASVALFPLDLTTGEPRDDLAIHPTDQTPLSVNLLPGYYLIVAKLDDGRFQEVYRQVPKDPHAISDRYPHRKWVKDPNGNLSFHVITIPNDVTAGMAVFNGSKAFIVGQNDAPLIPEHSRAIAPFYLDVHEVTIGEFRARFDGHFPGNLEPPNLDSDELPMTGTLFDNMVWCAERMGKRLPTEFEFEFAATNGGKTRYPWGNGDRPIAWELSPVNQPEFDQTESTPPVFGLMTNGAEYTGSTFLSYPGIVEAGSASWKSQFPDLAHRLPPTATIASATERLLFKDVTVRGGCLADDRQQLSELQQSGARYRVYAERKHLAKHVGFRCARSKTPRW